MGNYTRLKMFIKRKIKKPGFNINDIDLKPIDDQMGFGRGTPVDRIYIEKFLEDNKEIIFGDIMEIAELTYSKKFGHDLKKQYIFTADKNATDAIVGNLETGIGVKDNLVDSFILTQTFPFMYDIKSAALNVVRMLKKNGHAFITFRGVSSISKYDYERWGDFWGFTQKSIRKLFEEIDECEIQSLVSYGNVRTATAFLYSMAAEELKNDSFEYNDELYPVILGLIIKKR